MSFDQHSALLLIDLQNDFCAGGALAVPDGDAVIALANEMQAHFAHVIASKDWHPAGHHSFASSHAGAAVLELRTVDGLEQVLWPDHCVQGTHGSEFHPQLSQDRIEKIIFKGEDPTVDSYSAFYDNARKHATGLSEYLRGIGVTKIYVLGLATDYCVKFTCLDGVDEGFEVHLLVDACRGVELQAGDTAAAIDLMQAKGVRALKL